MIKSKNQKIQEEQYRFPYHYIPQIDNGNFRQNFNFSWGFEYLSYLHFVIDEVVKMEPQNLLDVGCGDGRFLYELKQKIELCDLCGVDYSEQAIQLAKIFNPNLKLFSGNICNHTLIDDKFDCITLIETLEHVPPEETNSFLEGISFYLKQEGSLLITVPSDNIPVTPKHYRHFSRESLEETLKDYFKVTNIVFLNRIDSLWFNLLKRILTNPLFVCNSRRILNYAYHYYIRNCLISKESSAGRIFLVCKKN